MGLVALFVMIGIVGVIIVGLSMAPAVPELILAFVGSLVGEGEEERVRPASRLRVTKVVTESEPIAEIHVCEYCGSALPEGSLYCWHCGAPC